MLADFRFAFRSLRGTPGFTAVALLVLALGIGATTAIFSVVDAVALRGLPYPKSDRLMLVQEVQTTSKSLDFGGYVAAPNFYDWRDHQHSFEDLAAFQSAGMTVYASDTAPESLRAMMVSASLMTMLRAEPQRGRLFERANETAGNNHVALISDALWKRRYNADPNIIGRTFTVGTPAEVAAARGNAGVWQIVGVMPEGFQFPVGWLKPVDVWTPYLPSSDEYPRGNGSSRNYNAQVIGRLKDDVSPAQAYADLANVTAQMKADYPRWFRDRWVGVTPLRESLVGKTRGWMFLLLGSVTFVLLIACVNVANLMLARATARTRDVGVRAALGASRWQLARALLAESLVLSMAGTVLGVAIAYWGVALMRTSLPPSLPRLADVGIDLRVLSAAAVASIVTGVFFGLLPAIQFSRPHLSSALREGGRSGQVGMARQGVRTALLVAEVALAVVLLVGAGLFVSSFVKLTSVDLGIRTENVVTMGVYPKVDFSTSAQRDLDMAQAAVSMQDVLTRARQIPGVQAAALMSGSVPLSGGWSRTSIDVPGIPKSDDPDDQPDQKNISASYFTAAGIPLLKGREFTDEDSASGAEPVIIINDIAADRYFKNQDPIGVTVTSNGSRRIVGVVRAVRLGGPEAPLRPEVYTPMSRTRAFGGMLIVRTAREAPAIAADLRAVVHDVLPTVVLPEVQTLQSMYERLILQRKFNMVVLALFGVLAMVIAAVGIYGVMAYIVEQRTQEIGVRMALGAEPGQVLRMILSRAGLFMVIGVVIGLGAGWALARFVSAFLFRVEAHAPAVYLGAALVLIAAGLAAAFVPAARAAKLDPVKAMR